MTTTRPLERFVSAAVRGRLLVSPACSGETVATFVGFHGYAESAEDQLQRLLLTRASENVACCAIQGLHLFYNRSGAVVASWMTKQDREAAIQSNLHYVSDCMKQLKMDRVLRQPVVFFGFSQGAAMAYRAASALFQDVSALVILAGDIPPDLSDASLRQLPATLIARGSCDDRYPAQQLEKDAARFAAARKAVEVCEFDGAHEWSDAFIAAVRAFLSANIGLTGGHHSDGDRTN
ncbi:MAG: dienelactone hydrolase family protein [Bdellovibrionales bacterium]|nr:dienelactone hydrolase family protein [Bdellovibrionales bacterium]